MEGTRAFSPQSSHIVLLRAAVLGATNKVLVRGQRVRHDIGVHHIPANLWMQPMGLDTDNQH